MDLPELAMPAVYDLLDGGGEGHSLGYHSPFPPYPLGPIPWTHLHRPFLQRCMLREGPPELPGSCVCHRCKPRDSLVVNVGQQGQEGVEAGSIVMQPGLQQGVQLGPAHPSGKESFLLHHWTPHQVQGR